MRAKEVNLHGFFGEEAEMALELLESAGHEAFVVGGCVRDSLMGKKPDDVDITTNARPEETKIIFRERGYAVIETGIKHGTVTVVIGDVPLEITTYRVDGDYSDHRRPDCVEFTSEIREDLARRDFTVNAMAWSPKQGLVDTFSGREDLNAGILRCVGDAQKRFREDGLRILRALRFASRFGFPIEAGTEKALLSEKNLLKEVSSERIFVEWKKILAGKDASRILIRYGDVLGTVIPELLPMKGFQQNNPHHIYDVWTHSVFVLDSLKQVAEESCLAEWDGGLCDGLRLAAILHDIGKPGTYTEDEKGIGHFYRHGALGTEMAEEILSRMKSDSATKERVTTLIRYHDTGISEDKRSIKRWLWRLGPEIFAQLLLLKRADNMAQNRQRFDRQRQYRALQEMTRELLLAGECFSLSELALSGRDLLSVGIAQGPEVGKNLHMMLSAVINEQVQNRREDLLAFLAQQDE